MATILTAAALLAWNAPVGAASAAAAGRAALFLPVATEVLTTGDVWGTPTRPGPAFMIAASLTVTQDAPLLFGAAAAPGSGNGDVTLTTANVQTANANTICFADTHQAASFTIGGGTNNRAYTVSLPGTTAMGTGISATSFTMSSPDNYIFNNAKTSTLLVAGLCRILSTAAAGTYAVPTANGSLVCTQTNNGTTGSGQLTGMSIRVAAPPTIVKTRNLDFGDVVASASAGTVTLDAATGSRTSAGGALLGNGIAVATAQFTVGGEPSAVVGMAVTPSSLTINRSGGGSMTIDNWTLSPASPLTLTGAGQTVSVGGRLNVGSSQAQGTYTGTLTFTITYQ